MKRRGRLRNHILASAPELMINALRDGFSSGLCRKPRSIPAWYRVYFHPLAASQDSQKGSEESKKSFDLKHLLVFLRSRVI